MSARPATVPPVGRRLLGAALRRYRENLGIDLDDAARILDSDRSKISRIETGQRGIRVTDLRMLLAEYSIGDEARDALEAIARPRGAQAWWRGYATLTAADRELLPLEAAASQILTWDPQRVPDLLQTLGYARALAACSDGYGDDDAAVMLADRQNAILDERQTPVTALIAESALRQPVAEPWIVREQIGALAEMAATVEHVTICVLPLSASTQIAATSPVTIFRFGTPEMAAAHLPGPQGGTFLDQSADTAPCIRAFDQLRSSALSPEASARRLRELAAR
jgi:transcriptional regulator with XRE-family HTH domain